MIKLLALLALSTAACVEGAELDATEQLAGVGGGSNGTHELQGRFALGASADGQPGTRPDTLPSTGLGATKPASPPISFSIMPTTTCLHAVVGGVAHWCADPIFNGYELAAAGSATIKIVASLDFTTTAPARIVTGYKLRYKPSGGTYAPYCARDHLAYPTVGDLGINGVLDPQPRLTFACSEYTDQGVKDGDPRGNGVFGKAISWGFVAGLTLTNGTRTVTTGELQLAATRMGRADYCHDGVSHTLEGTEIAFLDLFLGNAVDEASGPIEVSPSDGPAPIDTSQVYFEAVWTKPSPSGPAGGFKVDNARPLCLSKLRWSELPIGDICNNTVLDPRLHNDAFFCDDHHWSLYEDFVASGGVLVNNSRFNDLSLHVWTAGPDHFTTTRGSANGILPDVSPEPPFAHDRMLGTVVTAAGVAVWNAAYPSTAGTFEELVACTNSSNEHLTSTISQIPTGYGACIQEGYVWTTPPPHGLLVSLDLATKPLYRWKKNGGTDYYTSGPTAPTGYGSPVFLGHILEPRHL